MGAVSCRGIRPHLKNAHSRPQQQRHLCSRVEFTGAPRGTLCARRCPRGTLAVVISVLARRGADPWPVRRGPACAGTPSCCVASTPPRPADRSCNPCHPCERAAAAATPHVWNGQYISQSGLLKSRGGPVSCAQFAALASWRMHAHADIDAVVSGSTGWHCHWHCHCSTGMPALHGT